MGKFHRINQYIKAESVRVIGEDGSQLGVMSLKEALERARALSIDVVEVAESANPPVVKLIEFSKFKYQENKKDRAGAASAQETKEVRLTPFMAQNDLQVKLVRARQFLKGGDKVRLVVKFTGREITKKEFGERLMASALEQLSTEASIEQLPKMLGKLLMATIKPKK
ncbi:translation initiation factor IF-3 [Candidatus Collierbacteria bacterium RIFCSPLOWO2_01_FULL_50_23]|uniref:Translation initiation factor IF-3 n=2 Tax=Candidatus Collieribacteriota TaxID=1752725 RepID=A0A1F5ES72_9BACT|nr:MAG: translation initiation factor IF-3 [Candidatus Collierbacteria bacterium RIFCSPHIGHO2_02_FULL_49_10]OGD71196.1 MAG: translation initiation factor IF-3 [Candidatus Collierbacteria bacterium RIFCSPHIGHO2_01_FULL_50_25]OGD73773.1 MAG: translation initiation factor IF-3 [Candidatus Collierbacteria bacterium RIFCSPLOWO2_01_FULL_50_23]